MSSSMTERGCCSTSAARSRPGATNRSSFRAYGALLAAATGDCSGSSFPMLTSTTTGSYRRRTRICRCTSARLPPGSSPRRPSSRRRVWRCARPRSCVTGCRCRSARPRALSRAQRPRSMPRPRLRSSSIRRRSSNSLSASCSRPSAASIRARSGDEAISARIPFPRYSRLAARRRSS